MNANTGCIVRCDSLQQRKCSGAGDIRSDECGSEMRFRIAVPPLRFPENRGSRTLRFFSMPSSELDARFILSRFSGCGPTPGENELGAELSVFDQEDAKNASKQRRVVSETAAYWCQRKEWAQQEILDQQELSQDDARDSTPTDPPRPIQVDDNIRFMYSFMSPLSSASFHVPGLFSMIA